MGIMKKYTDDYETVITMDEKGHEKQLTVYRGGYFEVALDEQGMVNFKRTCIILLALIIIMHVGGGFVGNRGMYQFYVALPYVFAFFPLLYMAAGVFRLPKEKRTYRRDEIGLSFNRIKTASIILMVCLGIGVIGEITFLLLFSVGDQGVLEYLYLALETLAAAALYIFINLQRPISVTPVVNKNGNSN
jgi:hypothetical protein